MVIVAIRCHLLCIPTIFLYLKGANISQLERDIGSDQFPPNEHYFGLVNVSKQLEMSIVVLVPS